MQTFLPYPNFAKSASVLDYRRLGKQRVEAYQILRTLTGESKGWKNHPAVKMWRRFEVCLAEYGITVCEEWIKRGYKDSLRPYFLSMAWGPRRAEAMARDKQMPDWIYSTAFHASHRSNLLRKDSEYYKQFGWTEPDNLPYIWPK